MAVLRNTVLFLWHRRGWYLYCFSRPAHRIGLLIVVFDTMALCCWKDFVTSLPKPADGGW